MRHCQICRRPTRNKKLCARCTRGVRAFDHDPKLLYAAAHHLEWAAMERSPLFKQLMETPEPRGGLCAYTPGLEVGPEGRTL